MKYEDWMGNTYPDEKSLRDCIATSGSAEALRQCSIASWTNALPPEPEITSLLYISNGGGGYSLIPGGSYLGVTPSGNKYEYPNMASVTITATQPPSGYVFSHWEGDASGKAKSVTLTMRGNKTVKMVWTPVSDIGVPPPVTFPPPRPGPTPIIPEPMPPPITTAGLKMNWMLPVVLIIIAVAFVKGKK